MEIIQIMYDNNITVSKMLILCIQSKNLLIKYINDEILPSDSLKTHVSIFLLYRRSLYYSLFTSPLMVVRKRTDVRFQ